MYLPDRGEGKDLSDVQHLSNFVLTTDYTRQFASDVFTGAPLGIPRRIVNFLSVLRF